MLNDAHLEPLETSRSISAAASCPACASERVSLVGPVPDHEYAVSYVAQYSRCDACSTVFQTPMPRADSLSGFYPATYHSMTVDGWLMDARRAMRIRRLRRLLAGRSRGTVLDYGCGNGSFLVSASKVLPQYDYVGFEYGNSHTEYTVGEGRVRIIKGMPSDLISAVDGIDALIMNHVIEHLPSPGEVLQGLWGKLSPNAIFDGQTPNADSFEHRVFGTSWSGYHAPRHTVVFSRMGLVRLLESIGFKRVTVRGAFNPAGIAVSLASLPHGQKPGMIVRRGLAWHAFVAAGAALLPLDLASRAPGMIDFSAEKAS